MFILCTIMGKITLYMITCIDIDEGIIVFHLKQILQIDSDLLACYKFRNSSYASYHLLWMQTTIISHTSVAGWKISLQMINLTLNMKKLLLAGSLANL